MYIIVQKDKTVSVKLTLNPRPLHEMNKLSEDKHRFAYTLLPDEADPKYQQYRELCEAAFRGESEKVNRLMAAGTPLEWPDPLTPSVLLCGSTPKLVALSLKQTAGRLKPDPWILSNFAAGALKENDCATCDELLKALGKEGLTEKRKVHLAEYACDAPSAEPMRHLIEDLHFDPNMNMNNSGQNPLYVAVISGNVPATEYLLTKTKADPNMGLPRFTPSTWPRSPNTSRSHTARPWCSFCALTAPAKRRAGRSGDESGIATSAPKRSPIGARPCSPLPRGRRAGDEGAPLSRVNGTATEKSPATG